MFWRAFSTTVLKVGGEIRHIELRYWIAMILVAGVGDVFVVVVR